MLPALLGAPIAQGARVSPRRCYLATILSPIEGGKDGCGVGKLEAIALGTTPNREEPR